MELEDVLENLCVYDNRNPLKFSDEEEKRIVTAIIVSMAEQN